MGNIYSFEKKNDNISINNNSTINNNNHEEFVNFIDNIAINYIFTQNTIDIIKLGDKDYYDNMYVLTMSLLTKNLSTIDIGFLNHKIKSEKIFIIDKNKISTLLPKNNKMKKKMLRNICKYYMKIILIYSAIVSTLDPSYHYFDENDNKIDFYLKDFDSYKDIPYGVKPKINQLFNPFNLCNKRIDILKHKLVITNENVTINPGERICSSNLKNLNEEIGIKELDRLYCDIYDNETKQWNKKSRKMKKKYNKDLILFYQIFTGKKVKPSNIKSFNDIELIQLKTIKKCNVNLFKDSITVPQDDIDIINYLEKIKKIQFETEKYKNKLFHELKKIFLYNEKEDKYILHYDLTLSKLNIIESNIRNYILKLYTTCEKYFIQALLTFEKIYEKKNIEVNNNRLYNIENYKQMNFTNKDNSTNTYDNTTMNIYGNSPFKTSPNTPENATIQKPINSPVNSQINTSMINSINVQDNISMNTQNTIPRNTTENATIQKPMNSPVNSQINTSMINSINAQDNISMNTQNTIPRNTTENATIQKPMNSPVNSQINTSMINSINVQDKTSINSLANTQIQNPVNPLANTQIQNPVNPLANTQIQNPVNPLANTQIQNPVNPLANTQIQNPVNPPANTQIQNPVNPPTNTQIQNPVNPPTNTQIQNPVNPPATQIQNPVNPLVNTSVNAQNKTSTNSPQNTTIKNPVNSEIKTNNTTTNSQNNTPVYSQTPVYSKIKYPTNIRGNASMNIRKKNNNFYKKPIINKGISQN